MLTENTEYMIKALPNGNVEVMAITTVYRDGVPGPTEKNAYVVSPGEDFSAQPWEVRAVCEARHVPTIIAVREKKEEHQQAKFMMEMEPDKQELKDAEKAAKQALKDAEKAHKDFIEAQG